MVAVQIVNLEEMLVLRSGNDDPNLIGRGSTLICRRLTGLKWRYCCRRLFSAKVGAVDVAKLSFRFWDLFVTRGLFCLSQVPTCTNVMWN